GGAIWRLRSVRLRSTAWLSARATVRPSRTKPNWSSRRSRTPNWSWSTAVRPHGRPGHLALTMAGYLGPTPWEPAMSPRLNRRLALAGALVAALGLQGCLAGAVAGAA